MGNTKERGWYQNYFCHTWNLLLKWYFWVCFFWTGGYNAGSHCDISILLTHFICNMSTCFSPIWHYSIKFCCHKKDLPVLKNNLLIQAVYTKWLHASLLLCQSCVGDPWSLPFRHPWSDGNCLHPGGSHWRHLAPGGSQTCVYISISCRGCLWFSKSEVGPRQLLQWCWYCCSGSHMLRTTGFISRTCMLR